MIPKPVTYEYEAFVWAAANGDLSGNIYVLDNKFKQGWVVDRVDRPSEGDGQHFSRLVYVLRRPKTEAA